jgi:hypothetical protein
MNLEKLNEHYDRMIKYLEQPIDRDYEALIDRLEKLGILMTRAGQYMTECQFKIDEVVDIECKVNIELLDKYSASTFNMMVKAKAKDWTRLKVGFEKCCSASVHQIDAIRTIISFEKAKMSIL